MSETSNITKKAELETPKVTNLDKTVNLSPTEENKQRSTPPVSSVVSGTSSGESGNVSKPTLPKGGPGTKVVHLQQASNSVYFGTLLRQSLKGNDVIPQKVLLTTVKPKDTQSVWSSGRLLLPRPSVTNPTHTACGNIAGAKAISRSLNTIGPSRTVMSSGIAVKAAECGKIIQPSIIRQRGIDCKVISSTPSGTTGVISSNILVPAKTPTLTLVNPKSGDQAFHDKVLKIVVNSKECPATPTSASTISVLEGGKPLSTTPLITSSSSPKEKKLNSDVPHGGENEEESSKTVLASKSPLSNHESGTAPEQPSSPSAHMMIKDEIKSQEGTHDENVASEASETTDSNQSVTVAEENQQKSSEVLHKPLVFRGKTVSLLSGQVKKSKAPAAKTENSPNPECSSLCLPAATTDSVKSSVGPPPVSKDDSLLSSKEPGTPEVSSQEDLIPEGRKEAVPSSQSAVLSEKRSRKRKASSAPLLSKSKAIGESDKYLLLLPEAQQISPFKMEWSEEGIGSLPDSDLKMVLNEFGLIEHLGDNLDRKVNNSGKWNETEEFFCCLVCKCHILSSECFNETFCSVKCRDELYLSLKDVIDIDEEIAEEQWEKKKATSVGINSAGPPVKKMLLNNEPSKSLKKSSESNQDHIETHNLGKFVGDRKVSSDSDSSSSGTNLTTDSSKLNSPVGKVKKALATKKKKDAPAPQYKQNKLLQKPVSSDSKKNDNTQVSTETKNKSSIRLRPRTGKKNSRYADGIHPDELFLGLSPVGEKFGKIMLDKVDKSEKTEKNESAEESDKADNSEKNEEPVVFRWSSYMLKEKATAACTKLFPNPFPSKPNRFKVGQKLEAIDPEHQSLFCLVSVAEVKGYRLKLHFDGYLEDYDFWVNADSPNIFPIDFCSKNNIPLQLPPGMPLKSFDWPAYLAKTNSRSAPASCFESYKSHAAQVNLFEVDMKLEAVDKKNTFLVCVATVAAVLQHRILIHFDSWGDLYDYWVDASSPYIRPVGWCERSGYQLTPPNGISFENFSWKKYLKDTKSVAAPEKAFTLRQPVEFKKDMKIEAVDKRAPHLIRVATINAVLPYMVKISFDGFPPHFGYWVDDDSPDIHPPGWASRGGHPLEPPPTAKDLLNAPCSTAGCVGQGYLYGTRYETHTLQQNCPYSTKNLSKDVSLTNRLKWNSPKYRKILMDECAAYIEDSDEESEDDIESLRWTWIKERQKAASSSKRLTAEEWETTKKCAPENIAAVMKTLQNDCKTKSPFSSENNKKQSKLIKHKRNSKDDQAFRGTYSYYYMKRKKEKEAKELSENSETDSSSLPEKRIKRLLSEEDKITMFDDNEKSEFEAKGALVPAENSEGTPDTLTDPDEIKKIFGPASPISLVGDLTERESSIDLKTDNDFDDSQKSDSSKTEELLKLETVVKVKLEPIDQESVAGSSSSMAIETSNIIPEPSNELDKAKLLNCSQLDGGGLNEKVLSAQYLDDGNKEEKVVSNCEELQCKVKTEFPCDDETNVSSKINFDAESGLSSESKNEKLEQLTSENGNDVLDDVVQKNNQSSSSLKMRETVTNNDLDKKNINSNSEDSQDLPLAKSPTLNIAKEQPITSTSENHCDIVKLESDACSGSGETNKKHDKEQFFPKTFEDLSASFIFSKKTSFSIESIDSQTQSSSQNVSPSSTTSSERDTSHRILNQMPLETLKCLPSSTGEHEKGKKRSMDEEDANNWTESEVLQFTRSLLDSCYADHFQGFDGPAFIMLRKNELQGMGLCPADAEHLFSKICTLRKNIISKM